MAIGTVHLRSLWLSCVPDHSEYQDELNQFYQLRDPAFHSKSSSQLSPWWQNAQPDFTTDWTLTWRNLSTILSIATVYIIGSVMDTEPRIVMCIDEYIQWWFYTAYRISSSPCNRMKSKFPNCTPAMICCLSLFCSLWSNSVLSHGWFVCKVHCG